MSPLKFLAVLVVSLAVLGGIVAGGVLAYGREALWADLFGPPDLGPYAFDKPTRTGKPNDSLACPVGACADAGRVLETQIFAVDAPVLYAALREDIDDAFVATVVEEDAARGRIRAVIYSPFLRMPDTLNAEVRAAGPGRSTVFLYSRSQIGHADLGANEERLRLLLRHLRWTLPRVSPDGTTLPARKDQQQPEGVAPTGPVAAPRTGGTEPPAAAAPTGTPAGSPTSAPTSAPTGAPAAAPAAPSTSGRLLGPGPAAGPTG